MSLVSISKLDIFILVWITSLFLYGYSKIPLISIYGLTFLYLISRLHEYKLNTFERVLAVFTLASTLALVFLPNAIENQLMLVLVGSFFIVLKQHSRKLLPILTIVILFTVFDSIFQFIYGVDIFGIPLYGLGRVTGPFSWNSPVVGSFLTVLFFVPSMTLRNRHFIYILQMMMVLVIVLSGNRSNLLQILFAYFVSFNLTIILRVILVSLMISLIIYFISEMQDFDAIARIIKSFDIEYLLSLENAPGRRLHMWSFIISELPWYFVSGTVLGNSEYIILTEYPYGLKHPHWLYMEIMLNFGLLAFMIFAKLIWIFLSSDTLTRQNLTLFWGPFNMLHSINDGFWITMLVLSSLIVVASIEKSG